MPWVGEHPVLDLSNTLALGVGHQRRDVDLLADDSLLLQWRRRARDRRLAELPHAELVQLRELVREALDCTERGVPLPKAARERLNDLAGSAPVALHLDGEGQLVEHERGGQAGEVLARQTLTLIAGPERQRLRRCRAPACGMFFLIRRRDQAWCSTGCGNRVRAARRDATTPSRRPPDNALNSAGADVADHA